MKELDFSKISKFNFKLYEIVLIILFVLYLFSGFNINYIFSEYINNLMMYISLIVIIVILLKLLHPFVVLIFIFVVIKIIMDAYKINPLNNIPTEQNKIEQLDLLNTMNRTTLEEECVSKVKNPIFVLDEAGYSPIDSKLYNASDV